MKLKLETRVQIYLGTWSSLCALCINVFFLAVERAEHGLPAEMIINYNPVAFDHSESMRCGGASSFNSYKSLATV